MKYLYKYVYKGYDAAIIIVEGSNNERVINRDEVRSFIETRYVSPFEACYPILSKPLQCKIHSIICLAVHLPQQHSIIIANFPLIPQLVVNNHIEDSDELHGNFADMGKRKYTMLNRMDEKSGTAVGDAKDGATVPDVKTY